MKLMLLVVSVVPASTRTMSVRQTLNQLLVEMDGFDNRQAVLSLQPPIGLMVSIRHFCVQVALIVE